jgi:hypothetical protein
MSTHEKPAADRMSEQLDVQLLDVLAQIEALLRHGREIQRAALMVRGLPVPVSPSQRRTAGATVDRHVAEMKAESIALAEVLEDLGRTSGELNRLLQQEPTPDEA